MSLKRINVFFPGYLTEEEVEQINAVGFRAIVRMSHYDCLIFPNEDHSFWLFALNPKETTNRFGLVFVDKGKDAFELLIQTGDLAEAIAEFLNHYQRNPSKRVGGSYLRQWADGVATIALKSTAKK